jgi:DNA-binding CsgD family transcriptional regulator
MGGIVSYSNKTCNAQRGPIKATGSKCDVLLPVPQHDNLLEETLQQTHPEISLTKREREILGMVINGLTNRQMAQHLHRTERTVEYHRNHLMRKFDAKTAADLVKRAILSNMV